MDVEKIKTALATGDKAAAHAAHAGDNIVKAARERFAIVQARMNEVRARALVDTAAGDEYLALTKESGQLATVISRGE